MTAHTPHPDELDAFLDRVRSHPGIDHERPATGGVRSSEAAA